MGNQQENVLEYCSINPLAKDRIVLYNLNTISSRQVVISIMGLLVDLILQTNIVGMFLWCSYGISLISIYKHYASDIADPSSMQDACH